VGAEGDLYRALVQFLAAFPSSRPGGIGERLLLLLEAHPSKEERADLLLALAAHQPDRPAEMRAERFRPYVADPSTATAAFRALQGIGNSHAIDALPELIRVLGPEAEGVTTALFWLFRRFETDLSRRTAGGRPEHSPLVHQFEQVLADSSIAKEPLLRMARERLDAPIHFPLTWRHLSGEGEETAAGASERLAAAPAPLRSSAPVASPDGDRIRQARRRLDAHGERSLLQPAA
jgi:hypothetical protein